MDVYSDSVTCKSDTTFVCTLNRSSYFLNLMLQTPYSALYQGTSSGWGGCHLFVLLVYWLWDTLDTFAAIALLLGVQYVPIPFRSSGLPQGIPAPNLSIIIYVLKLRTLPKLRL